MIRYIGCETARDLLDAFIDGELGVETQVMVESHLRWCRTCAARVEDMAAIGGIVRLRPEATHAPHDDRRAFSAMQAEVLTRVRAERDQSLPVRLREMLSDCHLLWPALGASMAVVFCLCGAFGVMQLAMAENPESLAAMIASAHPGTETNPLRLAEARLAPRVVGDALQFDRIQDDDAVFAVATVVSREGRIANYELVLSPEPVTRQHKRGPRGDDEVAALLHAVKQSRFTPAQGASGRPVAVNMVWVFARTTVTRDAQLEELLNSAPQRRPVDRVERAAPAPEAPKPAPVASPATRLELPPSSSTA